VDACVACVDRGEAGGEALTGLGLAAREVVATGNGVAGLTVPGTGVDGGCAVTVATGLGVAGFGVATVAAGDALGATGA
jgi:hypothetical protein